VKSEPRRRAAPPIEVDARGRSLLGMPPRRFLATYWQKHPLLVRNAIAGFRAPLAPEDLAGLACEEMASSRLVLHDRARDRWTLRQGPFSEDEFRALPHHDWTVLVEDCDKLIGDVDALLGLFDFLPRWRLDDVMISYAAPGGSVGPHIDQYDVFLLQGHGHRRWQISTDPRAPTAFRDDAELRILAAFTPTHDWVLGPGDMLYLPPGVPHHGVAEDPCMTFSIGLRAPSLAELLVDCAEERGSLLDESRRYTDPELAPPRDPALVDAATLAKVRGLLAEAIAMDDAALGDWFGGFITRYRTAHQPVPADDAPSPAMLLRRLGRRQALYRNPWSRYAWQRRGPRAVLHHAGDRNEGSLALARLLQAQTRLTAADLGGLTADDVAVLADLVARGHWVIDHA
jgi:50S ribosomal protein L16 3-hydroxylase